MTIFARICSLVLSLIILGPSTSLRAAVSGTIPLPDITPPSGYENMAAFKQAVIARKAKLIQPASGVPDGIREIKNIEYGRGGTRALELDLYLPAQPNPEKPTLLFIHGGAWASGARDIYKIYTVQFAQRGYIAATASYRLSGEAPFPAAVHDTKCAVRWLRAHADQYGINPQRIVALGASAGGHLALMLGYTNGQPTLEGSGGHPNESSAVQAVVNFYGAVDLTTNMGRESRSVRNFLGGKTYDEAGELYRQASPLFHLKAGAPPTLTIHGTTDAVVKVRQGDLLNEKLAALAVPHAYVRLNGWHHALDLSAKANTYCTDIVDGFLGTVFEIEE